MYKYLPYASGRQTYILELAVGIRMLSAQRWLFAPPFAVSFPSKVNKRKCVVPENIPHTPPSPSPRRATVIPRGGGGGVQKKAISERCGMLTEFFSRGLSKIGELLINNSFSVEQAISYYTATGVALIIFYLRSAKCFISRPNATVFIDTMSSAHE